MKYKKIVLSNGLRVILCPLKDVKTVSTYLMVKVGSRNETDDVQGISHFLEHMFFKGTKERPKTIEISKMLDGIGARYNAYTSKNTTGFYVKSDYKKIDISLYHISDIIMNSLFKTSDINKEKGVIVEEINMYEDNPLSFISYLFENLIFKGNSLERDIAGTKESVLGMKRTDIVNYWKTHYTADNMVLAIAGNFDEERILKKVKKYFGKIKSKNNKVSTKTKEKFAPFKLTQNNTRLVVKNKKSEQSQLIMGFPAFSYLDNRQYALSLLAIILGGNSSSRLFLKIRDTLSLCYSIHASAELYSDTGVFYIKVGFDKTRIKKALEQICFELKKIKTKLVTDEELTRAKDFISGSFAIALENSSFYASYYAENELFKKKVTSPAEELRKINKVTKAEIKKVANDIFDKMKLNIAVLGEHKEIDIQNIIEKISL